VFGEELSGICLRGGTFIATSEGAALPDEPWPLLTIACHWSHSCDFDLKFQMAIVLKSSTEASHLISGLPTRVPSDLSKANFLQGFCSCILKGCPTHVYISMCHY
jgi:hypothetical protein